MFSALAPRLIGLSLLALPPTVSARADGDPLEIYDFTGKASLANFVQQSRTHVLQHGLWTVQYYVDLDPFRGKGWALHDNRAERVCVYYGTRPLWSSEPHYKIRLSSRGTVPGSAKGDEAAKREEAAPKFVSLVDETEGDIELSAVDCTGGDGITLLIHAWDRSFKGGSSAELIRLSGTTPATAKVESLWRGGYEEFDDLNADGIPEIIDVDRVHEYASYMPYNGSLHRVVLEWDPVRGRFLIGDQASWPQRHEGERTPSRAQVRKRWIEEGTDRVRKAVLAAREARLHGGEYEADEADKRAVCALSSELTDLLWAGELEEARRLFGETSLHSYGEATRTEDFTSDTWWESFVTGCKRSRYWPLLCEQFPQLTEL